MIEKYIQELLKDNNRVILPDFGAFLVRATSKHKDSNDLALKLPDVYFSPFLKFNDELLVKYVIDKEKITKEDAMVKIKAFIEEVKKVLEEDKPFKFEDFGEFVADKQGKVQFNPVAKDVKPEEKPKEESKLEAKKPAATAMKEEKPKVEPTKEKIEAPKVAAPKADVKKEEVKKEEPKKEEVKKEAPKAKVVKAEEKPKVEPAKKPEAKPTVKHTSPTRSYTQKKEGLNKGLIWTIAISVPVAVLLVLFLINFDKFFGEETKPKPKAKQEKTVVKKPVAKDTAQKQEAAKPKEEQPKVAEKKTTQQKQVVKSNQKKYYIIAGSFRTEKYAQSFMNDLIKKGYKAERLPERDGMHAVSYASYVDKQKALAELNSLTKDKGLTAWLLYY